MLTPRQHKTLDMICGRVASGLPAPSFAEIGRAVGVTSRGSVYRLVHGLEARGFLKTTWGKTRSIAPLKFPDGSDFDPNHEALVKSLISAYEDGAHAARAGHPKEPCPFVERHAVAWGLGWESAKK